MEIDLSVKIGRMKLKNPVMAASGTFGYAEEFKGLLDLKKLGAIVTKSITLAPREGNEPPRIWETPSGMLNAIGLQNGGVGDFIKNKLPFLKKLGVPIIASIAGSGAAEYAELAGKLDRAGGVAGLELNISCPNVKGSRVKGQGSRLIAQDAWATKDLVSKVRAATKFTLITKLSPNVTDITEIAKAAEDGGSDAVSLVNTFLAMAIDINTKRPVLGNVTGGLSGPAIKPIALRMVWETARAVKIPVIGIGGIMNAQDALEFFIAGATAIQVGTANFVKPNTAEKIIEDLRGRSTPP